VAVVVNEHQVFCGLFCGEFAARPAPFSTAT
jgi:hypothetical protein